MKLFATIAILLVLIPWSKSATAGNLDTDASVFLYENSFGTSTLALTRASIEYAGDNNTSSVDLLAKEFVAALETSSSAWASSYTTIPWSLETSTAKLISSTIIAGLNGEKIVENAYTVTTRQEVIANGLLQKYFQPDAFRPPTALSFSISPAVQKLAHLLIREGSLDEIATLRENITEITSGTSAFTQKDKALLILMYFNQVHDVETLRQLKLAGEYQLVCGVLTYSKPELYTDFVIENFVEDNLAKNSSLSPFYIIQVLGNYCQNAIVRTKIRTTFFVEIGGRPYIDAALSWQLYNTMALASRQNDDLIKANLQWRISKFDLNLKRMQLIDSIR